MTCEKDRMLRYPCNNFAHYLLLCNIICWFCERKKQLNSTCETLIIAFTFTANVLEFRNNNIQQQQYVIINE